VRPKARLEQRGIQQLPAKALVLLGVGDVHAKQRDFVPGLFPVIEAQPDHPKDCFLVGNPQHHFQSVLFIVQPAFPPRQRQRSPFACR
jgi:hypothetical protein